MGDDKPKKRLIAASSDEDEEAGLPLAKRVKAESSGSAPDNNGLASNEAGGVSTATSVPFGSGSAVGGSSSADAKSGTSQPDTEMTHPPAASAATPGQSNGKAKVQPVKMESESSDEEALSTKAKAPAKRQSKTTKKKRKADPPAEDQSGEDNGSDFEQEDKPKGKTKRAAPKKAPAKRAARGTKSKAAKQAADDEDADDDEPPKKRAPAKGKGKAAAAVKKEEASPVKKPKKDQDEEDGAEGGDDEEDDDQRFAFLQGDDGTGEKWQTLEHNGVLFPPDYEPLPKDVKLYYDGKPVHLPPESEEVAGFFAAMLDTDHAEKQVFRDNFFHDFKKVLEEHPPSNGIDIQEWDKLNFRPMADWFEAERQRKKSLPAAEKKRIKAEKDAAEEKYKTCLLNGKVEKMGNFRVEPPGLFRGRGAHPKTGKLKHRVQPEQILINIGKDAPVPQPPAGHKWGGVQHDNKVSWLAFWRENINGNFKYVFLAAGSSLKGASDFKKFEKARKLKFYVDGIRLEYETQLKDKVMQIRQRATAVYLIDRFALRAGNEKGEDEADTVGCCSLKCSNITLTPPCNVLFDFLGKDSIRFLQAYDVSEQVFKNLRIFKKEPKTDDDLVFDRLNTGLVNDYLRNHMEGLSAKVFRTYNASWTFQQELDKRTNPDDSVHDKILSYNRANRDVAILCNHQRSVAKTHANSMNKMQDKLRAHKYQRRKLRWALFGLDEDNKNKFKEYEEDESDLDEEWVEEHEKELREAAKERARKRFERDQAKIEEGAKKEEDATESAASPVKKPAGKSKAVKKEESDAEEVDEEEKKPKRKGRASNAKAKQEESDEEDVKPTTTKRTPKLLTEEDLQNLLDQADADFEKMREETQSQKVETNKTEEKLLKDLEKKDQQIAAHRSQILDRDEGKEVSLGTSKLNYIDPRLTFAWCKKYDVPIEKMFSKTLREKFAWAASTPADWRF